MGTMTNQIVDYLTNHREEPPLTVWSAHDSTLISLLCAFRLKRPSTWPEYASCLMLELLQEEHATADKANELYVRFSLNGEILPSHISVDGGGSSASWVELVPLTALVERIRSQEKVTAGAA